MVSSIWWCLVGLLIQPIFLLGRPPRHAGVRVLAMTVERLVYRPIRKAGKSSLITALGVFNSILSQNLMGADRPFPDALENKTYMLGELMISKIQIIIILTTIILMGGLRYLVMHTKIGKAMRATSYNLEAAELMGINTNKVISFTFFVRATLAGAAGVLVGMYYNTVEPMMGLIPGLKAFVAAVLGGIGVIPGAVLGGLVLGVAENLVIGFWVSTYRDAIAFAILIIILLIRPVIW